jgi:uncharacterized membrane protein
VTLERSIARVLAVGTYVSIALVALGTVLLLATGRSPLDPAPGFALNRLASDVLALRPEGFLWLGILASIATPAARVVTALVGYRRRGERDMTLIALLILIVIAIGVAIGAAAA